MNEVVIVATGLANVASVAAGLRRVGAKPVLSRDPEVVRAADAVVLPGVGAFGPGMRELRSEGLDAVLSERIDAGRPTLGVCLGMQLLARSSDETPGAVGLSLLDVHVGRFDPSLNVPQMGWNQVNVPEADRFLRAGDAYFANSFRMTEVPAGWNAAFTDYGGRFVSALTRGDVLTCQFHPELSGKWGTALLERWFQAASGQTLHPVASPERPSTGKASRVVPCLDVKNGRVVKGIRFQGLRDAGDPIDQTTNYERQGADELVVLDVAATRENRGNRVELIRALRDALSVPLTVGGGVRTVEDARALLGAGADKVSMNTAAVLRPELLTEVAEELGGQCTVVAIDAARREGAEGWEIVIRAGTERTGIDAVEFAAEAVARGAGEILLTSWDRDGTGDGYDNALIRAIADRVSVPIIASGGAKDAEHMEHALSAGADAVLAATIFHDGHNTVGDVKASLRALGAVVRIDETPEGA